jgi:NifU-like protein involved in Fe-S cluster formation
MYSPQLLDHFEHPRNAGTLESPSARAEAENPACGDVMEMSLEVREGRISDVRFRAKGCVAAVACGSAMTELIKGKSLDEAADVNRHQIIAELGALPTASQHAVQLALDTLHASLAQLKF